MVVILPSAYRDGTTSVTQGSDMVEGHLTLFRLSVLPGDWYSTDDGYFIMIAEVIDDTHLRLIAPYPGATISEGSYSIMLQSDIARMQETTRQLLETLRNGNLVAFAGLVGQADRIPMFTGPGTLTLVDRASLVSALRYDAEVADIAARAEFDGEAENFRVLVLDADGTGRAAFFTKLSAASGDWSEPIYLTGTVGPVGPMPIITASATDLPAGSSATATTTETPGGYNVNIGIPLSRGAGFPYQWSAITDDADPGNGFIRANDTSLASSTMLYVSKTSVAGSDLSQFLMGLASSTNETTKGDIILQDAIGGATVTFSVTDVEDAVGYVKVVVSSHSGATSFSDGLNLTLSFNRSGDKGLDGTGVGDVVGPDGGTSNNGLAGFSNNTGKRLKQLTVAEAAGSLGPVFGGKNHPAPSMADVGLSDGDFDSIDVPGVYSISGSWVNGNSGVAADAYSGTLEVYNRDGVDVRQVFVDDSGSGEVVVWFRSGSRESTSDPWVWRAWVRAGDVVGPDGGSSINQVAGFADGSGKILKQLSRSELISAIGGLPLRGYISPGFNISNSSSDPDNDLDFPSGVVASRQEPYILMSHSGVVGMQLDVAWGVGNGARFDSVISDGWWHCFIISNGEIVSRGMSKSLDPTGQPNYPAGFTYYRRVASWFRVGGSLIQMTQTDDDFEFAASNAERSSTAAQASTLLTIRTPLGLITEPWITVLMQMNNVSGNIQTQLASAGKGLSSVAIVSVANDTKNFRNNSKIMTNTSSQVQFAVVSYGGSLNLNVLATIGYTDKRSE